MLGSADKPGEAPPEVRLRKAAASRKDELQAELPDPQFAGQLLFSEGELLQPNDFLSTNELPGRLEGQTLRLTVARLDGFRLLWLEQGAKARLAPPPAVTPVKPAAVAPRGFWRRFWDWLKSVWDWCFG